MAGSSGTPRSAMGSGPRWERPFRPTGRRRWPCGGGGSPPENPAPRPPAETPHIQARQQSRRERAGPRRISLWSVRAVVFESVGAVRLADVPDPVLEEPGDAIVDVGLSAICGSDMHLYHGRI